MQKNLHGTNIGWDLEKKIQITDNMTYSCSMLRLGQRVHCILHITGISHSAAPQLE